MILVSPPSPPPALTANRRFHRSLRRRLRRNPASYLPLPSPSLPPLASASSDIDAFTEYSGYLFELSTSEADSLTEYNISKIAAIYRNKPLVVLRRLLQIVNTLGKWFVLRYIDSVNDRADQMFEVRAAQLRKILLQLGPAYIKIAQAVSSRADLIPPSYLDELSLLQDRIAPFSTEVAFNTIEKELGSPMDELFSEISAEPVAAASLGQVYQAKLRPSGRIVAIKVQRPGVQAAISLDILILRYLAGLIRTAGKFNTDLQAVVDEWASSLFREMDYNNEAKNGLKFRQLYGGLQDVVVPEMYVEQTTRKVLTMEWVEILGRTTLNDQLAIELSLLFVADQRPREFAREIFCKDYTSKRYSSTCVNRCLGQKLSDVKDLHLVEIGVYCSFNQLLEYGFYHADPHPGNLFRTYDGKLAYLDFGMMGEFKQELRDGFIEACLHLVNRDFDALAKDFVTLGLLPPTADKDSVTKALTGVFQSAVAKGVRNISFGDLLGNLGTTMYKFKFQIPSYFSLVIRSLAVLEGIAIGINPNYKVLGSTYPWIARKVLTDSSPKLKSSLQDLLYKDGVFRIDRLESLLEESLRARTERALVKKQVEDNNTRVVVRQILSFTLTEKGSFVREILLEELAKGLDALGVATLDSIASATTPHLPFVGSVSSSSLTDEDVINLKTLHRLVLLLSGFQRNESSSEGDEEVTPFKNQITYSEEASAVFYQFATVQRFLPFFSIIPELPPDLQQQFLRMPADLAGKLFSRAAARTIRKVFL